MITQRRHSLAPCVRSNAHLVLRMSRRAYHRPPFAPKPILDIKHIRQSPGLYEQNCIARNYKPQSRHSWEILSLHEQWTQLQRDARSLREKNNAVRRQLANLASSPDNHDRTSLLSQAKTYKTDLESISDQETRLEDQIESLALQLPNLSSDHTPFGPDPIVLETINPHPLSLPTAASRTFRSHTDIGTSLSLLDFSASATTSGWGWYFLLNEAVMLEHALVQYALSVARRRGWSLVAPPSIVYSHIASACGFMPRDANGETQIYGLAGAEGEGKDKAGLVLAGTGEIPFAGMGAGMTMEEAEVPRKVVGASRCYRAEAGARGVDTKGLYRVHEFTKVEMFAWTERDGGGRKGAGFFDDGNVEDVVGTPQEKVFEEMLGIQKEIIGGLGLHGRVLEMPATDLGASAQRKIDIEVWFPSRKDRDEGWGEVTSASMCGDYQTRRLGTRIKRKDGKLDWPFTVNGTAMAVPRVLAAILENGWDEERGVVDIPEVLRPWMAGLEIIGKKE